MGNGESGNLKGLWWAVGILATLLLATGASFMTHIQLSHHIGAESMAQKLIDNKINGLRQEDSIRLQSITNTQTQTLQRLATIEANIKTIQDQTSQIIDALSGK